MLYSSLLSCYEFPFSRVVQFLFGLLGRSFETSSNLSIRQLIYGLVRFFSYSVMYCFHLCCTTIWLTILHSTLSVVCSYTSFLSFLTLLFRPSFFVLLTSILNLLLNITQKPSLSFVFPAFFYQINNFFSYPRFYKLSLLMIILLLLLGLRLLNNVMIYILYNTHTYTCARVYIAYCIVLSLYNTYTIVYIAYCITHIVLSHLFCIVLYRPIVDLHVIILYY